MELVESDEIERAECWELLGTVSVGRLALSLAALPAILPVQFYVDGSELAICLGHFSIPERSVNDAIVAFAADRILSNTTGWAVQVQGTSRTRLTPHLPADCGQPNAGQIVRLEPATVTGHRVRLCPFAALAETESASVGPLPGGG
jgi:hypothetical protein